MPISKALLDLHLSPWESTGAERPVSTRTWIVGQEPPPDHFNFDRYWTQKDVENFVTAVETYLLPQAFYPDGGISLIGDDAGAFGYIQGATAKYIPVVQLEPGVDQELQVKARVKRNNAVTTPTQTLLRVIWSTAAEEIKTAVFQASVSSVASGSTFTGTPTVIQKTASDSVVRHGRVVTEIQLGVLVQGNSLDITLAHLGTHESDDIASAVCIHAIEVI
jgi:hypothetical protein